MVVDLGAFSWEGGGWPAIRERPMDFDSQGTEI